MSHLPKAEEAYVPPEKLRDYVLSVEHALGRHKARVFAAALGIDAANWEYLRDQIKDGILRADVAEVKVSSHGTLYTVPLLIQGLNGESHEVTTAWIIDEQIPAPRLTSAYVNVP